MANVACKRCGIEKEHSLSYFRIGHNKKLKRICRDCETSWALAWNMENKDRIKNKDLLRKYGITLEEYRILSEVQNHKCAICKVEVSSLCVDHNHKTGKVRGLLCHACNLAIGNLKEDITRFLSAISYLERYQ